jgi:hypothetical protein
MRVRADGRAGPEPVSDVAGEIAEARTEPDAGADASAAELRSRYEQALTRVDELHRRLREADRTLGEPADLRVDTDVDLPPESPMPSAAPLAPEPTTRPEVEAPSSGGSPDVPTIVRSRPLPPLVTTAEPPSAAEPESGQASRTRKWEWAGVAGASLVVAVIAAFVLLPAPRAGDARDATASEGQSSEERVASPPSGGEAVGEATSEGEPAAGAPAPGSEASAPEEWPLVRHVNAAAGYSFSYPETWTLDESGEVTTVSSPDGRYVVSFALGPRGPLEQTYDSFVALLERSYSDVGVTSRESLAATDGEALLIGGNAVNTSGARVVFRALLLAGTSERPTIGAIAATDSAGPFDERLVEVLTSVEAA